MKQNMIKKAFTTLALSSLLLLTQFAIAMPKAFQADYAVSKGSLSLGNLRTTLKYSGNKYAYHKYTKATGLAAMLTGIKITENSDGQIIGKNFKPINYLYNRAKRSKSKIDKIQFANNRANGSYRNDNFNLAINSDVQDKASLELSLARDLKLNKTRLSYTVISKGKKSQYNFQKLGNEQIKTKAGTFNAVKVKVIRSGTKRETIFWMAKELDYIPVKVRHREKDNVITTIIKSYKKL